MNSREEIIQRYFRLSDMASDDDQALNDIIALFASTAVVKGANGITSNNPNDLANFFKNFFEDNQELRHLCRVTVDRGECQAEWSVAGRKKTGGLFALHGFDHYQFNAQNKIIFLQVEIKH
ncbi:hypothetical protein [Oenococcus sicerae]|uniref:SnoaL-like domain-containing protein n=1 Tax=Oenococcus sicerae TaxID=2203724 RepID=A0AAJ1R9C2_9LACO|nr:hypothetical protein [Oenococcus sicerae]MDN6900584.1 hypothetical protein [Oenococcus sicerae]